MKKQNFTKVCYQRQQVIKWLQGRFPEVDFSEVEKQLPPLIWRSKWDILADKYGLPFKRRYLQNLDSEGIGPLSVSA